MTPKSTLQRTPPVKAAVAPPAHERWSKLDRTNPVSVEDFDRERMGVAAKE
jgi:hypothetical protein